MTYCVAAIVDEGIVFLSDSRTNAGIDQVSEYPKCYRFVWPGEQTKGFLSLLQVQIFGAEPCRYKIIKTAIGTKKYFLDARWVVVNCH